ncbi:MAG: ABC transporter ATP-binding protein [Actinomycetota bacterium]|nr:ABC transporter ATP-binding protein [Actinomycetota bacterium]
MSNDDALLTEHADGHTHSLREPTAEEVVLVRCVQHSYDDGTKVSLCGLDFVAQRGQRVAILGPNGSGKTTMLYHILGLLKAQKGMVRVFGADPSKDWATIRRRIGVMLQNVEEQLLAPTVYDDVAFSPRQYGLAEVDVTARVNSALAAVGIENLRDRVPHNLSGGEKRKVALAGAIVMEPELLVLDEPFEGLDPASREMLVALLEKLARGGVTVVMTTHDIDSVAELADFAYVLAPGGTIAMRGTPTEVFENADVLAAGNIRPPVLAVLFAGLRDMLGDGPVTALTVEEAVTELARWKQSE